MKILALSTSTQRGSAAVLDGDRVLGASGYADLAGHAERIFAAVTEALDVAGLGRSDIGLVACDVGPGSFTGVRVGVASAKGLAMGLGVPLVGVGSLEAMAAAAFAAGVAGPKDVVVAVLDAKKQEFFLGAYDAAGATLLAPVHVLITEAQNLVGTELARVLPEGSNVRIVGEASRLEPLWAGLVIRGPAFDMPDAASVGRLARQRFASSLSDSASIFDAAVLEPSYVRPPDAKPMAFGGPT